MEPPKRPPTRTPRTIRPSLSYLTPQRTASPYMLLPNSKPSYSSTMREFYHPNSKSKQLFAQPIKMTQGHFTSNELFVSGVVQQSFDKSLNNLRLQAQQLQRELIEVLSQQKDGSKHKQSTLLEGINQKPGEIEGLWKNMAVYAEKYPTLRIRGHQLELERINAKVKYLKRCMGIGRRIDNIFAPVGRQPSADDVEQAAVWVRAELKRLGQRGHWPDKSYHGDVEWLLTERFLAATPPEKVMPLYILKAAEVDAVVMSSNKEIGECNWEELTPKLSMLRNAKKGLRSIGNFLASPERRKEVDCLQLEQSAQTICMRFQPVYNQLSRTLQRTVAQLSSEVLHSIQLRKLTTAESVVSSQEVLELLQQYERLLREKCPILQVPFSPSDVPGRIEAIQRYETVEPDLRMGMSSLLSKTLKVDYWSNHLQDVTECYRKLVACCGELVKALKKDCPINIQLIGISNHVLTSLTGMTECSRVIRQLRQSKEFDQLEIFLRKSQTSGLDLLRRANLRDCLTQMALQKRRFEEIHKEIGSALPTVYSHPLVQRIEIIVDRLQRYVWNPPTKQFDAEALARLVLEADEKYYKAEPLCKKFYTSITLILLEPVKFAGVPSDPIRMTQLQYGEFLKSQTQNAELRKEISKAVSLLSKSEGVRKVTALLAELPKNYDRVAAIHTKLEQLKDISDRLGSSLFVQRLRDEMGSLIIYLFIEKDRKAAAGVLHAIQQLYEGLKKELQEYSGSLAADQKVCRLLVNSFNGTMTKVESIISGLDGDFLNTNANLNSLVRECAGLLVLLLGERQSSCSLTTGFYERFGTYISEKVAAATSNFRIIETTAPNNYQSLDKAGVLKVFPKMQQAVTALSHLDERFLEQFEVEAAYVTFGIDRSVDQHKRILTTLRSAIESVEGFLEALPISHQMAQLRVVLAQFLNTAKQLFKSEVPIRERCALMKRVMDSFKTQTTWWSLNIEDIKQGMLYMPSQQRLKVVLTSIILQSCPAMTQEQIDNLLQTLCRVSEQTIHIPSVDGFHYRTNTTLHMLTNKKLLLDAQLESHLRLVYQALWKGVILGKHELLVEGASTFIKAISALSEDIFKASDTVLAKTTAVSFEHAVQMRCKQIDQEMMELQAVFSDGEIGIASIDRFTRAVTLLSWLDTTGFNEFRQSNSSMRCFLYRSEASLQELIEAVLLHLFEPDRQKQIRGYVNLMGWWRDRVMSLRTVSAETVVEQVKQQYSVASISVLLEKQAHPRQLVTALFDQIMSDMPSQPRPQNELSSIAAIKTIAEHLKYQQTSISSEAVLRHSWLADISHAVEHAKKEVRSMVEWLERTLETIQGVEKSAVINFSVGIKRFASLIGLESKMHFLMDSKGNQLGALLDQQNITSQAKILTRKHFSEHFELNDELLGSSLFEEKNGDVTIRPSRFHVNLLKGIGSVELLLHHQARLLYGQRELISWSPLGEYEVKLAIDQLLELALEIRDDQGEVSTYKQKSLQGRLIRFDGVEQKLEQDVSRISGRAE